MSTLVVGLHCLTYARAQSVVVGLQRLMYAPAQSVAWVMSAPVLVDYTARRKMLPESSTHHIATSDEEDHTCVVSKPGISRHSPHRHHRQMGIPPDGSAITRAFPGVCLVCQKNPARLHRLDGTMAPQSPEPSFQSPEPRLPIAICELRFAE